MAGAVCSWWIGVAGRSVVGGMSDGKGWECHIVLRGEVAVLE